MPAALQFGIWLIVGMLIGGLMLFVQTRRIIPSITVSVLIAALVGLFSGTLEIGNANAGWGLFAAPAFGAGAVIVRSLYARSRVQVVYLLTCVFVIAFFLLPQYFMLMDGQELNRSYAEARVIRVAPILYVLQEAMLTNTYLAFTFGLLVLPALIRYVESRKTMRM